MNLGKESMTFNSNMSLVNKDNFHCPCSQGLKLNYIAISDKNLLKKSGLSQIKI